MGNAYSKPIIQDTVLIYKISSKSIKSVYIGSTTQEIDTRLKEHVSDLKRYLNDKFHYITSFGIIAFGNFKIELLEECEEENRYERERWYIQNIDNVVNDRLPSRNNAEWYQDNKEIIHEKKNKKCDCPCGGKYTYAHKAEHFKTEIHKNFVNKNNNIVV